MVTVAISDLIALEKIKGAAKSAGVELKIVDPREPLDLEDNIYIVDFLDPYGGYYVARNVKNANPQAKVVGFFPHVRAYMKQEAEAIGCVAFTNSEFFSRAKDIVRGKF